MPRTSKAIAEIDARCAECDFEITDLRAKLDAVNQRRAMLVDLKAALASKPKAKPTKRAIAETSIQDRTAS